MTENIWIDQQASFTEIEASIFAAASIADELPRIPTAGNATGPHGLRWAIDDALNLNRMSGRSGAVSSVATRPVPPMQVFVSPDDDRRAGACAPLTPGVRKPVAAPTDSGEATKQR
jgi:hypothetical protein